MAVPVTADDGGLDIGRPERLFDDDFVQPSLTSPEVHTSDVTADGSRLVMIKAATTTEHDLDVRIVPGWVQSLDLD